MVQGIVTKKMEPSVYKEDGVSYEHSCVPVNHALHLVELGEYKFQQDGEWVSEPDLTRCSTFINVKRIFPQ